MDKKKYISASRILSIVLTFFLYIVSDYVVAKFTIGVNTGLEHWTTSIINLALIISIMLTVRSMRKDNRCSTDETIVGLNNELQRGFKKITINGFSSRLDEYLVGVNKLNKCETYKNKVRARLIKIAGKDKYAEERKRLEHELTLTAEEIWNKNFKYNAITVSKLFSAINGKILNDNEFDLDTYEGRDIAKMVGIKALFCIFLTGFAGSALFDLFYGGIAVIYSTVIKLFSLLTAINTAKDDADQFADCNIKTALQRRYRVLAGFVNETPELKTILEKKTTEK